MQPPTILYCFPYAGASVGAFRPWAKALAPQVDVRTVVRRGDEAAPDCATFIRQVGDELLAECRPPYALYGHSMGAREAFEFAREARRRGHPPPVHLFVSGAAAPCFGAVRPFFAQEPDDVFIARLRFFGGMPSEALDDPKRMRVLLPLLRADFARAESYRYVPDEPLDVPISVWGGTDDLAPIPHLAAWADETRGVYRLRVLAGGHFFIWEHQERVLDALARDLARTLREAEAPRASAAVAR